MCLRNHRCGSLPPSWGHPAGFVLSHMGGMFVFFSHSTCPVFFWEFILKSHAFIVLRLLIFPVCIFEKVGPPLATSQISLWAPADAVPLVGGGNKCPGMCRPGTRAISDWNQWMPNTLKKNVLLPLLRKAIQIGTPASGREPWHQQAPSAFPPKC